MVCGPLLPGGGLQRTPTRRGASERVRYGADGEARRQPGHQGAASGPRERRGRPAGCHRDAVTGRLRRAALLLPKETMRLGR